MNLVCYSSMSGGALFCNVMNRLNPDITSWIADNEESNALKAVIHPMVIDALVDNKQWVGTHFHPTTIQYLDKFDSVCVITVTTRNSKLLRWLRWYYGWFVSNNKNWAESDTLEAIDTVRSFAKLNAFTSFEPSLNCINIEFEDLVSGDGFVKLGVTDFSFFEKWKSNNRFVYTPPNNWALNRFNEAEWELKYGLPYQYL